MIRTFIQFVIVAGWLLICRDTQADSPPDTVVVKKTNSSSVSRRRGEITDWNGSALTLLTSGRTLRINNEDIEQIETDWSADAVEARQRLKSHQFLSAIAPLKQAITDESREWARTILRAELVTALATTQQHERAVEQFRSILATDPNTRFLSLAPLAWTSTAGNVALIRRCQQWIDSDDPTTRLLAASWLIGGPQQEQALDTLEQISRSPDEQIAQLATAQIWRSRRNVSIEQLRLWQRQVTDMPIELQAGPTFVLATRYAEAKRFERAVILWMRLPILHADRPDLASAALYRSARLLHNEGDAQSSEIIRSELVDKFSDSDWAERCRTGFQPVASR